MNKWLKIAVGLSTITLTGAGAFYLYANYKALDDFDFEVTDVKIKGGSDKLTIKVIVKIKNPTDFNLKVYGYDFKLSLDGVYVGNVKSDETTSIAKNSESEIEVPFEVYKKDFDLSHITDLIKLITKAVKSEKIKATINGSVTAGFNKVIKKDIAFEDFEVYTINE